MPKVAKTTTYKKLVPLVFYGMPANAWEYGKFVEIFE
jgi:hypothetical protein